MEELEKLLAKRASLERNLAELERQIYAFEESYLLDSPFGNVVVGFDGYLTSRIAGPRKFKIKDSQRIFSLSSSTALKVSSLSIESIDYSSQLYY